MINKIDVCRLSDLEPSSRALVQEILDTEDVKHVEVSCYSEEGVMALKNAACDALLAHRVDTKLKGSKVNSIINRIHVAQPKARDDVVRGPHIPEAAKNKKKYDKNDPDRKRLQRDVELEEGGAGVFNINMKRELFELFFLFSQVTDPFSWQRITFSKIPSGKWTRCLRLWTGRTSLISLIRISLRNSKRSRGRRRGYKLKASMTAGKIWYESPFILRSWHC